jgi:hypothetical protein
MFDVGYVPPSTPPDKSLLHNTTFSPDCRKPSLTPVSYPGTVDIQAGAAWSIKALLSTHLNEIPANGGQNFHGPAEGL